MMRPAILPPQAAQDRRPRGVRTRVRPAIRQALRTGEQGGRGRHRHGFDRTVDCRCRAPIRAAASRKFSRIHGLRRRRQQSHSVWPCWPIELRPLASDNSRLRRIRTALRSQGSRRLRAHGVRDLAPAAIKYPLRHRSQAAGNPGKDFVCLRTSTERCHPERR